jgi:hypothetical protein
MKSVLAGIVLFMVSIAVAHAQSPDVIRMGPPPPAETIQFQSPPIDALTQADIAHTPLSHVHALPSNEPLSQQAPSTGSPKSCVSITGGPCVTACNDGQWSSTSAPGGCAGHGGSAE